MSRTATCLSPLFLTLLVAVLAAPCAGAADYVSATAPTHVTGHMQNIIGSFGALFIGLLQLVIGLAMVAFSIKTGLVVVSKLLGGLDIWGEIKKRNIAVALVAAGVVISYTGVIGSGLDSMTKPIAGMVSADPSAWLGGITGLVSGLLQLLIAVMVASFAITVTFKVMDSLTKDMDEKTELVGGNIAVGVLYCGVLIGVSQVVSSAVSGVGLGVQGFLSSLLKPLIG